MAINTKTAAKPVAKPAPKASSALAAAALSNAHIEESRLTVSRVKIVNNDEVGLPEVEETVDVRLFATTPAKATCFLEFRKNLGNFEGVKFSVGYSMPHYVEQSEDAAAQVIAFVKQKLDEVINSTDLTAYTSPAGEDPIAGTGEVAEEGAEATEDGEGQDEVTPDTIRAMDRDALVSLITENSLEIEPDDYPEDSDLAEVIISIAFAEEGAEGGAAEGDGDGDGTFDPYTEDQLMESSTDDLKALFETWELGKYPAGPEAVAKKAAVRKILKFQEGLAAAE